MSQFIFRQLFLTKGQGGRSGRVCTPKGLVIHWTANTNKGADALANRNYFENHPQNKVSAHYCVDDRQVIQCIPENEMAYHVGANTYKDKAVAILGTYPNATTIGIEMCVNSDGNFQQTYANTVTLATEVLTRWGMNASNLWRHYDITGKNCPAYFVTDSTAVNYGFTSAAKGWEEFMAKVDQVLQGESGKEDPNWDEGSYRDIQGSFAQESIERLTKLGLLKGDPQGTFRPNEPMTRAEVVVFIDRVLQYLGK